FNVRCTAMGPQNGVKVKTDTNESVNASATNVGAWTVNSQQPSKSTTTLSNTQGAYTTSTGGKPSSVAVAGGGQVGLYGVTLCGVAGNRFPFYVLQGPQGLVNTIVDVQLAGAAMKRMPDMHHMPSLPPLTTPVSLSEILPLTYLDVAGQSGLPVSNRTEVHATNISIYPYDAGKEQCGGASCVALSCGGGRRQRR